jgi:elongation factor Ts
MVNFEADSSAAATDGFKAMGKDVAMQIAAMSPQYLDRKAVPTDVVEYEKGIIAAQLKEDPKMGSKPQKIIDGIIEGKTSKLFKDMCLVEQQFVKNGDFTVNQYVDSIAKEIGSPITITGFVRFAKGEGLQKKEENFADEVAGMIK